MSQQVATVLLVTFVVVLAIIVFLWGKNYIQEKAEKHGKLAEKQLECENIGLEVVNAYQQGDNILITLKNTKDKVIGKFVFRVIGNEVEIMESYDKLDSLSIKQYQLAFQEEIIGSPSKVDIIPWLSIIRGYYVPCSKKSIETNIG